MTPEPGTGRRAEEEEVTLYVGVRKFGDTYPRAARAPKPVKKAPAWSWAARVAKEVEGADAAE